MADFNQILTPGDVDAGIINVVNEIPEGSCHKIMEPQSCSVPIRPC